MTTRPHFFDLTPDQLEDHILDLGMPRFRAKQIMQWVYEKQVADPQEMTNLSKIDRDRIAESLIFLTGHVIQHQSATDGTEKLLIQWDPDTIPGPEIKTRPASALQTECVMIPAESQESGKARFTACISSQCGCPVRCKFCASGLAGLDANLTSGQILEQVFHLNQMLANQADWIAKSEQITNIVFMGMGEPLSNYNAVTRALRFLNADWGFGISARKITVSTVGLPAQIRRLADADELPPVTLAISLHAPDDEIRRKIIPWAEFVTIGQLLEAGRYYFEKTGREITIEYILLRGLNDQPDHARQLARIARSLRSNVNLIRYNEVAGLPFGRPATEDVHQFQEILRGAGVNAHIRASRGRDIAAACGQLRHESSSPTSPTTPITITRP